MNSTEHDLASAPSVSGQPPSSSKQAILPSPWHVTARTHTLIVFLWPSRGRTESMNPSHEWGMSFPHTLPSSELEKHMLFCPSPLIIFRICPPRALATLWQLSQSKARGPVDIARQRLFGRTAQSGSRWKFWLPLALANRFDREGRNLW